MTIVAPTPYQAPVLNTPFHSRIAPLCLANEWVRWAGYNTVDCFTDAGTEYFAIRHAATLFDASPMCKYRIAGPDAEPYMNRLQTRDMAKLKPGRVAYTVWCDDNGHVLDDGTVFRFSDTEFRLNAQEYHLCWFEDSALGFDVTVEDVTASVAGLALQGPMSCAVLRELGLAGIAELKPFGIADFEFEGGRLCVTRTGFTGDLGYELWIDASLALDLWDELFEAGKNLGIRAIGTSALDIARIETGFIQAGDDFTSAIHTIRPGHDRSPFELGLDWQVNLDKPNFTGRKALIEEKKRGSKYRFVKLDIAGNKPAHAAYIFHGKRKKAGVVTSAVWSPTCKQNIAFASLEVSRDHPLDNLWAEVYYQRELQWNRVWLKARVQDKPFWNPKRRRATPPGLF